VAVSITRRVTRYARLLEMCDVPEKGRDHRAGSVAADPAGTNLACGHGLGSSGLSHSERKIIAVNATRLLSSIDPFSERWCSAGSRRSELRSISLGRPRRSAPGSIPARQPARKPARPLRRQAGTWRWVGVVGFRADGNGGRPDGMAGNLLRGGVVWSRYYILHLRESNPEYARISRERSLAGDSR